MKWLVVAFGLLFFVFDAGGVRALTVESQNLKVTISADSKIYLDEKKSDSSYQSLLTEINRILLVKNDKNGTDLWSSGIENETNLGDNTVGFNIVIDGERVPARVRAYSRYIKFSADLTNYRAGNGRYFKANFPVVKTRYTVVAGKDQFRSVPLLPEVYVWPGSGGDVSGLIWRENSQFGALDKIEVGLTFEPIADDMARNFRQMAIDSGIAVQSTTLQGSPLTKESYFRLRISPADYKETIDLVEKSGVKVIQIDQESWVKNIGSFDFNDRYPNGIADLKTITDYIHSKGMLVQFHATPFLIYVSDPLVTDVNNKKDLYYDREYTLGTELGQTSNAVSLVETVSGRTAIEPGYVYRMYDWDSRWGEDFLIGEEIITCKSYDNSQGAGILNNCVRGNRGSVKTNHQTGEKIRHLVVTNREWGFRTSSYDDDGIYFAKLGSPLMGKVFARLAEIYHQGGFDWVFIDGSEHFPGRIDYQEGKAQEMYYRALGSPDGVVEASGFPEYSRYFFVNRYASFDGVFGLNNRKNQVIEAGNYQAAVAYAYFNYNLGWFMWGAGWDGNEGQGSYAATREEVVDLCYRAKALKMSFSIHSCKDCFTKAASRQSVGSPTYNLDDVLSEIKACIPPSAITGKSPSPSPTSPPASPDLTPTPTATAACRCPGGNCQVNLIDFANWRKNFLDLSNGGLVSDEKKKESDMNCDGGINLIDFVVWRSKYLHQN